MAKHTIAVDFDDVILAEAQFVVEYSNTHWGYSLTLEDYRENWREMWAIDDDAEFLQRVAALHAPGIQTSYDLINGAEAALRKLKHDYELIVVTSRLETVKQETTNWVEAHLPDIFSELYFTGFYDGESLDGHTKTKGRFIKDIGVDYLIDDQPKHCFAAAEEGIEAVLFGDYAVSRHLELPAHVTRCDDWKTVLEYFDGRA